MDHQSENYNLEIIWSCIKWFFGGLSAIFSVIATALMGKMWREHNKMYESHVSDTDPEKRKLKDQIIKQQQDSLEKCYKDVADIKHKFSQLEVQVRPILERMADEEMSILERLEMMNEQLIAMARKNGK